MDAPSLILQKPGQNCKAKGPIWRAVTKDKKARIWATFLALRHSPVLNEVRSLQHLKYKSPYTEAFCCLTARSASRTQGCLSLAFFCLVFPSKSQGIDWLKKGFPRARGSKSGHLADHLPELTCFQWPEVATSVQASYYKQLQEGAPHWEAQPQRSLCWSPTGCSLPQLALCSSHFLQPDIISSL